MATVHKNELILAKNVKDAWMSQSISDITWVRLSLLMYHIIPMRFPNANRKSVMDRKTNNFLPCVLNPLNMRYVRMIIVQPNMDRIDMIAVM